MVDRFDVGSAHGRFQPLHKGHMEYLLAAKERCDHLWVGITQYNVRSLSDNPVDPHRTRPQDNPLTYFERVQIIREAFAEEGITEEQFGILPFPIETPQLLRDFLSTDVPVFTTVYDDWNRHKIRVLREAGYEVITLWERDEKEYKGTEVREKIMNGDPSWEGLVPPATVRAVRAYNVRERLLFRSGATIPVKDAESHV